MFSELNPKKSGQFEPDCLVSLVRIVWSISTEFYSSFTFTSGDKMISWGISSNGTNPCTPVFGSDYITGEDGLAKNITSANLFIGWPSIYNLKIS